MKIIVTGGAGFIGSHLVDALIENNEIIVVDNLSAGKREFVNKRAKLIVKDLLKDDLSNELADCDLVFHMAADPDVRISAQNPRRSFEQNVLVTYNVLEECRKNDVKRFVFSSTSAVYGDAEIIPTPEDYSCKPISNYAASKLSCEGYISSFAHTYGIKATVLRYANIYGERSTHGVMRDFYLKLLKNPKELEILGNGKQEKSYLHVSDCVSATLLASEKQKKLYDVFNVGSKEKHTVDEIASTVSAAMGLKPIFRYTGGERGWEGDVKLMLLDIKKLAALGWKEKVDFVSGITRYINWLKQNKS